jgi:hypothetical protein
MPQLSQYLYRVNRGWTFKIQIRRTNGTWMDLCAFNVKRWRTAQRRWFVQVARHREEKMRMLNHDGQILITR